MEFGACLGDLSRLSSHSRSLSHFSEALTTLQESVLGVACEEAVGRSRTRFYHSITVPSNAMRRAFVFGGGEKRGAIDCLLHVAAADYSRVATLFTVSPRELIDRSVHTTFNDSFTSSFPRSSPSDRRGLFPHKIRRPERIPPGSASAQRRQGRASQMDTRTVVR